jgi:hypothetical protein
MNADYELLGSEETMVLAAANHSTAKRFVNDPASTLLGLDHQKLRGRTNYLMRDWKKDPLDFCNTRSRPGLVTGTAFSLSAEPTAYCHHCSERKPLLPTFGLPLGNISV